MAWVAWLVLGIQAYATDVTADQAGRGDLEWTRLRPSVQADSVYELAGRGSGAAAAVQAVALARTIDAFLERYPETRFWNEAGRTQRELLMAVASQASSEVVAIWKAALARARNRSDLTEAARYRLDLDDLHFTGAGLMATGEREGALKFLSEGYQRLIRDYPDQVEPYERWLMMADDLGRQEADLGREILSLSQVPARARQLAEAVLDREKRMAAPLDWKFTATDGRVVDLVALRGKVVLVDFWATWCGPCVAELPNLVDLYQKHHAQGFEIVGISLDSDRGALDRFVNKHGISWPQHFSGSGWETEYARQFGIRSIPTMWLLDHTGRIVDRSARGEGLGKQVERLLAARPGA